MKKLIVGVIIGLALGFTFSAGANTIIGKAVDTIYPLFIDGTRSPVDAVSIEGTSYIPVRKAGEMFGYEVQYNDTTGEIFLKRPVVIDLGPTPAMEYKIKSNIITVAYETAKGIQRDGEFYLELYVFKNYYEWSPGEYTVNIPGHPVVRFPATQSYKAGVDGYTDHTNHSNISVPRRLCIFIKLSALGLKATEKDGVLWIEDK